MLAQREARSPAVGCAPTDDDRRSFAAHGLLRLPGAIPDALARALRERIWERLERRFGVRRDVPWPRCDAATARAIGKSIRKVSGLQELYTEVVCDTAQALLGDAGASRHGQLLLFTAPRTDPLAREGADDDGAWRVPRMAWHTDAPRLPGDETPGIIALAYLDAVLPGGGGTVVVAGSHRLGPRGAGRTSSKRLKRHLRRHGYFRDLWSKDDADRQRLLHREHIVDGVTVRLTELAGAAGDVVLVDARILHSLAPNRLARPRLMARGFFASDALLGSYAAPPPAASSEAPSARAEDLRCASHMRA